MGHNPDLLLFELARQAQVYAWKRHCARKKQKRRPQTASLPFQPVSPKQCQGAQYETRALALLMQAGLHLLARNVRCKMGEIDLIMQEGTTLVFVEVRARTPSSFGSAAASVGDKKRIHVIRAAAYLLPRLTRCYWHGQEPPVRFDVVAFEGDNPCWLRHAFVR